MIKRIITIGFLLALEGCAFGPKPPKITGVVRAPINPDAVKLYAPKCVPTNYEMVAKLDASMLGIFSSYQFNLHWVEELRGQAAGIGANGLLLSPVNSALTIGATRHGPAFEVEAIRAMLVRAPTSDTSIWAAPCAQTVKLLRYEVFHGWGPGMAGNGSQ